MTPYCRHIKTNGRRCCSMAMRGKALCYFHSRLHAHHRTLDRQPADATPTIIHSMQRDPDYFQRNPLEAEYFGVQPQAPFELDLPTLEDRESIQVALSMLLGALARNRIDTKSAGLLLYGLQVASSNAKSLSTHSETHTVSETILDESGQELALDEDPEEVTALAEAESKNPMGYMERLMLELSLSAATKQITALIAKLAPHDPDAAAAARQHFTLKPPSSATVPTSRRDDTSLTRP
jgi:hypothetical protein